MKQKPYLMITLGWIMICISGCSMLQPIPREEPKSAIEAPVNIFNFEGLPSQDYYVGGGFIIRYRASQDGILYVAEDDTGRLLATISMTAGEKYEIIYDINDEDMIANLRSVGIDPEKAVIKVYYVPEIIF